MRKSLAMLAGCALMLSGCSGDDEADEIALEGERYAVLLGKDAISPDPLAQAEPIDLPSPQPVDAWVGNQARSVLSHIAAPGFEREDTTTIGEGRDFDQRLGPAPVSADGVVYAMDASGYVSAHKLEDIDARVWQNDALVEENEPTMIGGGLFIEQASNILYAASGYGQLAAINAATGKTLWRNRVGAPMRGAPAADAEVVVVITANNETIAMRVSDGQTLWEHRGIRESAGFFSTVSPIIWQGTVLAAYSSGEVVALNLETGSPIWTDTLITDNKTQAAAAFTGVNATPVVQDGVAYLVSGAGSMVANAVLNGRPLWEAKIGSTHAIWGAGNMLYVLTPQHQLVALLKATGKPHWVADVAEYNDDGFDITPQLFAPILVNDHILIADRNGLIRRYDARTGKQALSIEVDDDLVAAPISVGGQLITVHKNAQLQVLRP